MLKRLHDLTLASPLSGNAAATLAARRFCVTSAPWLCPRIRLPPTKGMFPVENAELPRALLQLSDGGDPARLIAEEVEELSGKKPLVNAFASTLLSSPSTVLHLSAADVLRHRKHFCALLASLKAERDKRQERQRPKRDGNASKEGHPKVESQPNLISLLDDEQMTCSRVRIHCFSSEMAAEAIQLIRDSKVNGVKSDDSFQAFAGIVVPFPSSEGSSRVAFRRRADAVAQQIEEIAHFASSSSSSSIVAKVPLSVFLLSSLSCPFGGGPGVDPVRVGDCAVHFLSNLPAGSVEEVLLDDTGSSCTGRHLESSVKTLLAVANGRVDIASQVSFALRKAVAYGPASSATATKSDNIDKDEKTGSLIIRSSSKAQNTSAAVQSRLAAESAERLFYCVTRATQLAGVNNFCGVSAVKNISTPTTTTAAFSSAGSSGELFVSCWPSLVQVYDWSAGMEDRGMSLEELFRPQESSLASQERIVAREHLAARGRKPLLDAAVALSGEDEEVKWPF